MIQLNLSKYLSSNSGDFGGVLGVTKEGLNTLDGSRMFLFILTGLFCKMDDSMETNILIIFTKHFPILPRECLGRPKCEACTIVLDFAFLLLLKGFLSGVLVSLASFGVFVVEEADTYSSSGFILGRSSLKKKK